MSFEVPCLAFGWCSAGEVAGSENGETINTNLGSALRLGELLVICTAAHNLVRRVLPWQTTSSSSAPQKGRQYNMLWSPRRGVTS